MRLTASLAALCLAACPAFVHAQKKPKGPDPALVDGEKSLAMVNALEDWTTLFNGKDLTGWGGDTENYTVEDGVLVCPAGAKVLHTEKEYGDFVFSFQFKNTPSGNNGIGIRAPAEGNAAYDGMEIQILDHDGDKYGKVDEETGKRLSWLKPWQVHGSLYGLYPAKTGYLKPVGEWNEETIICINDHVKVILNGAAILDVYLDQLTPLDGHDHPGMKREKGHILLAGHSDHVEFRDLKVKDLSVSPPKPETDADNTPPAGFTSLFNGTDLTGWKGLAHKNALERRALEGDALKEAQAAADEVMREHWRVEDGTLVYDGLGQSLCTAKDYGDFELYVDWKIPPGADSGLYLRGTPQVQIWDPWDKRAKEGEEVNTPEEWVTAYKNGRNLGSGGLWNNKKHRNSPLVLADNPPSEWNTFFIRMVGEKVSIWLNGKLIVDDTVLENYWDKTGLTPVFREDQIELQHHGSELFFKNLYLRELPY